MASKWLKVAPVAGVVGLGVGLGIGADKLVSAAPEAAAAKQDVKPAVSLPITRVVMFNSGVGYFSRSGEVTDDARVDLSFQETDINDLLKSMVLEDFGKGRIAAVSYDSREPISRTLSSYAINLNGQPTFAGIVAQMRGERIEVVTTPGATNQPGKLSGVIVGVETQKVPAGTTTVDAQVMNMWCAEGLRAIKLSEVQQLRFANPVIESEFRRALDTLALTHDSQKKSVSLHFAGDGPRKVQVGYVVEAPIWKTSYRMVLADKEKPYLQGWALVENPTDEDWAGVKMALISGRPISFKMDLYNPLYISRPTVEPELFASLRPVTYRGGFAAKENEVAAMEKQQRDMDRFADKADEQGKRRKSEGFGYAAPPMPTAAAPGLQLANGRPGDANYAKDLAKELGSRPNLGVAGNAATAGALGDFFQYTIDHPVTLGRQKSAMLPIVGKDVEGQKVSIYNQSVQKTHPLLGLKFKNTSGAHLNQGPITVLEGSVYAGDTRVLDVQPNEERLVSYAIDLGTEVDPQVGPGTQKITSVKAVRGIITTKTRLTEEKKYRIVNRSQTDRTLLIEHANRTNQQFKLVDTDKPVEDTPDVYRFQTPVKAQETKTFVVKEERELANTVTLTNNGDDTIRHFINLAEAGPELKAQLTQALKVKETWDLARRELAQVVSDLARLNLDQERIRKNLRETPKEAEVYATYLKKLSDQEKEIDALTAKQKSLMTGEFAARKKYDDFLANISD
ncbi:DUF4139 domain-containing protein [Gemmata sp.]|uniref:DUF4139 domain-containing protein n=1 Tax=Gemmata sp. TaxID=1914242 RepID=UPI003F707F37